MEGQGGGSVVLRPSCQSSGHPVSRAGCDSGDSLSAEPALHPPPRSCSPVAARTSQAAAFPTFWVFSFSEFLPLLSTASCTVQSNWGTQKEAGGRKRTSPRLIYDEEWKPETIHSCGPGLSNRTFGTVAKVVYLHDSVGWPLALACGY